MANLQQAPKLKFDSEKNCGKQYYQIPQEVADVVFNKLGNSSAQLRIMMVLIGTKEGFGVSEAWILQRTGLQKASYITARKKLVERGWLSHKEASFIQVNFKAILAEASGNTTNTDENSSGNTVYTQSGNTVYTQRGNTVYPITNKETNKETNNKEALTTPNGDVKSSMVAPVEEEVEENQETVKIDGRIARKELVAGAYEYINEEKTLIKTKIGKIFEVYDTNTKVEVIAVGDNKPKATFVM